MPIRQTFELDQPVLLICTESKRPDAWGYRLIVRFDDSTWPEPVYVTMHHGLGTRDKIMEYAKIRGWKVVTE
jgi:hypothetical protein